MMFYNVYNIYIHIIYMYINTLCIHYIYKYTIYTLYIYIHHIYTYMHVFFLGFIGIAVFLHIWGFIKDMGYLRRTNLNRWEVMINWGWTF